MLFDKTQAAVFRERTSQGPGIDLLVDAWSGFPKAYRGAVFAAQGDLMRAAAWGGGGWACLAKGDVKSAFRAVRTGPQDDPTMILLKAETLLAAGAVVAGLEVLEELHDDGDAAGSLALARRRYLLGDYDRALSIASALPMHAGAALLGARAALALDRPDPALRLVEPFLAGAAPLPEPAMAGAMAVIAASIMARKGSSKELKAFVEQFHTAPSVPGEMLPTIVRAMWIGGAAATAWDRVKDDADSWNLLARLELAVLSGRAELAATLLERAGPSGVAAAAGVALLRGETAREPAGGAGGQDLFAEGARVHIWQTHAHRWSPWINAAMRMSSDVAVFNLAEGTLPDKDDIPQVVLDDGSLVTLLPPVQVPRQTRTGSGVWVEQDLCRGIGINHDWPDEEISALRAAVPEAGRDEAAVLIVGSDTALAAADSGRPMVVVAPPGDPFWGGPFPERAWPALCVERADPRNGWNGAGRRVAETARSLFPAATEGSF